MDRFYDADEWAQLIQHARTELRPWRFMTIQLSDDFILTECRLLGLDIEGHMFRIDSSRLRHVVNRHAIGWVEGDLGQLPIRSEHIAEIPNILCKPHAIERAPKFNSAKPALLFRREYAGIRYEGTTVAHVIVSVRTSEKPKKLLFETMYWKRPG